MFFISYENDLWSSTILVPSPATYSEADTVAEGGEIMEEREREKHLYEREEGPKKPNWRSHSGFYLGEPQGTVLDGQARKDA